MFDMTDIDVRLAVAASEGDVDTVKKMIREGADVNRRGSSGQTALIYACVIGNLEIVKLLVSTGAEISIRDNGGRSAIDHSKKHPCVYEYLMTITGGNEYPSIPREFINEYIEIEYFCPGCMGTKTVRTQIKGFTQKEIEAMARSQGFQCNGCGTHIVNKDFRNIYYD